ncbi:MAG: proton-conducting transporter membrane subunit [Candidatus Omnitrophica bacterium]|nr:proton-conducting transporter membrane subunit [Candidatus Omnitrophota bacterium]
MKALLFFVIVPLAGAFLIAIFRKRPNNFSDIIVNLAALSLTVLSLYCMKLVNSHKIIAYKIGGWLPPLGISLVLDGLSGLMLVIVNLVVFLVMIYALRYMQSYTDKWKFHALFMLMLAGMNGVILSSDLFNLYVFLELASICGYALVAFGTEAESLEASFKYLIMGAVASIFILLGIVLIYSYVSTLNMADISLALSDKPRGVLIGFVSVLFLAGFGLKAALVPFHSWLPDAHSSAPTPVSAVLSGVFIKTLGIYALARIFFNVLGVSKEILFALMVLGILSMVVGAFLAIAQNDIKRMFAYSSISQVGYIIFAFGIATPLAVLGGLFHLFNHAIFKSLLFLNAGAIEYSTGRRDLRKLGGLSNKLPVTGATSLLGSMSISGIPPLGGFWSKLIIIVASVQAGYIGFAVVAVLVSIVTLAYYLKFQAFAFFAPIDEALNKIKDIPATMKLSMVVLAGICVIAGLMLIPSFRPVLTGAADVLLSGVEYKYAFLSAIK